MATTPQSALFTDFYSITMSQGYWKKQLDKPAVFEMFFRRQPYSGGYAVFAGLETLLTAISNLQFTPDDIEYLRSLALFDEDFLDYLRGFKFTGSLYAMDEGRVVFPQEPLIRVEGGLIECQILEGALLNIINFQTLIATKAARVWLASRKGAVMEFGLRRAQGPDGALSAARAAYIGGASGTSNVLAGKTFGIPVLGTMAHSWVMAFTSEEEAFQAYADIYPKNPVFLIDTYDTLRSGAPNAIKVGKRLAEKGQNFGVRLDSGDIHYLAEEVRKMLDAAGLPNATISASNDLDESIIQTMTDGLAPINTWGVGTNMITGAGEAAFAGVYKLIAREDQGRLRSVIKFSDNPEKTTTPGVKQVSRIYDTHGMAVADALTLEATDYPEESPDTIAAGDTITLWHPSADYRHFVHTIDGTVKPLLTLKMDKGALTSPNPPLADIRRLVSQDLDTFDNSYKRILNPHIYKVSVTEQLRELKLRLIKEHLTNL